MEFSQGSLFSMLSRRIAWLGKRQEILSQNIANSDTPGYKAQDLEDTRFQALLKARTKHLNLARTDKAHFTGAGAGGLIGTGGGSTSALADTDFRPVDVKPDGAVGRTGNTVDIEDQMLKVSNTAIEHQMATTLYRKHLNMIRSALGRG